MLHDVTMFHAGECDYMGLISCVKAKVYQRMLDFSQAALLCQFLDEVDYTMAFKCLSETMSSDASDCYYDCIWDVNILEFLIALHSKRNEHNKKQKAVSIN